MAEKKCVADNVLDRSDNIEIVVAHYNEDLAWLQGCNDKAIIYSKGDRPDPDNIFRDVITLPNIGRESHTILHHIVSRYDSLAPITLFVQGDREGRDKPHTSFSISEMMDKALMEPSPTMTTFENDGSRGSFNAWDGMDWKNDPGCIGWLNIQKSEFLFADRTPSEFWAETFGYAHPEKIVFAEAAFFAVHATVIRRRPLAFYERLLGRFTELNHTNPEVGHFMERFWGEIFLGPIEKDSTKQQV